MGSSAFSAALAVLGAVTVGCGFDWEGTYDSRFGGNAAPARVGGSGGGSGSAGEAGGVPPSGGQAATGGEAGATAGDCTGNLLSNPGFELASNDAPADWDRMLPESAADGSFSVVATPYEGSHSLLVDTTGLRRPSDYLVVISEAHDVTTTAALELWAAAWTDASSAPVWVALLYFDVNRDLLTSPLTADHLEFPPSSGFVSLGPRSSPVPRLAAWVRVGVVAGQGVSARVDSICLTR